MSLTVSPTAPSLPPPPKSPDVGKLAITTLGGFALLLIVISAGTTSSPPSPSFVSLIRIQFVLAAFEPNCSPADNAVNVAVPEPDTVALPTIRLTLYVKSKSSAADSSTSPSNVLILLYGNSYTKLSGPMLYAVAAPLSAIVAAKAVPAAVPSLSSN